MATSPYVRRSHILSLAAALMLAAPAAFAELPEPTTPASITDVVRTGDLVGVTLWSGRRVKGQVLEADECSLLLRAGGAALRIEQAAIKTVRRYPPPKQKAGKGMVAAVERCDRVDCQTTTLAVVGLASLFKELHELGRQPKVVYRAPGRADLVTRRRAASCR